VVSEETKDEEVEVVDECHMLYRDGDRDSTVMEEAEGNLRKANADNEGLKGFPVVP